MSQPLAYAYIEFFKVTSLATIIATPDKIDVWYIVHLDLN